MPESLVGVNTLVPNRLAAEAIEAGGVESLNDYSQIRREVKAGDNSRIDLLLTKGDSDRCYVEIKNCTLVEDSIAYFPDAVTSRGLKHLGELQKLVSSGSRCVMFYLIQRTDAELFKPADQIDPEYGRELRRAVRRGVEILVYDVCIDLEAIRLNRKMPYKL
jgi:sugar fermentation stimulation protein A